MQIKLSPADENYIKEAVRNGDFPSEEEAVATAVTRMRQETEARRQILRDAIQRGRDDVGAGRVEDYRPELLDHIFEAIEDAIDSEALRRAISENDGFTTLDAISAKRGDE